MIYVLIFVAFSSYGSAATIAEFNSIERCQEAGKTAVEMWAPNLRRSAEFRCVLK